MDGQTDQFASIEKSLMSTKEKAEKESEKWASETIHYHLGG